MNLALRALSVLGLAAAALSASAQVTYALTGDYSFTLVTNSFITGTTTFSASSLVAPMGGFSSVTFRPVDEFSAISSELAFNYQPGSAFEYFNLGAFTKDGVYTAGYGGYNGTLVVSGTPVPTPEPSALAALGLGAVGLLRRRKRA